MGAWHRETLWILNFSQSLSWINGFLENLLNGVIQEMFGILPVCDVIRIRPERRRELALGIFFPHVPGIVNSHFEDSSPIH